MKDILKPLLLLALTALSIFEYVLNRQCGIFREFEAAFLSLPWMRLVCLTIWCGSFLFLTFNLNDLPLIGVLLIVIAVFFISHAASSRGTDAVIVLAGLTLGKSAFVLLRRDKGGKDLDRRRISVTLSATAAAWFELPV